MIARGTRPLALSAGEHALIGAARALVAARSETAPTLLAHRVVEVPRRLSRPAMGLLQRTLAVGGVRQLALRGGRLEDMCLCPAGRPSRGRLWERHDRLPPLRFGGASLELCRWLARGAPEGEDQRGARELASGDVLLLHLALSRATGELARRLGARVDTRSSLLAWLTHPVILVAAGRPSFDFASLAESFAAADLQVTLEALGPDLARRVASTARAAGDMTDPDAVRAVGDAWSEGLETYLDLIDELNRRDLASPLVDAAAALFPAGLSARDGAALLCGRLDGRASLADRQRARRAAGAFPRALERIAGWHEEARYVRVFEDDYDRAQALLARWEPFGAEGFARAAAVAAELRRLDVGMSSASTPSAKGRG